MTKNQIIDILSSNKTKLSEYGVRYISLFGSYYKDSATKDSDIDFLVKFKYNQKSFDNYMDLKYFLEDKINKKIDLVIEENIKTELKEEILKNSEILISF